MCMVCQALISAQGLLTTGVDDQGHNIADASEATSTAPRVEDFSIGSYKWGQSAAQGTSGGVVTWSLGGAGLTNQSYFADFFTGSTVNAQQYLGFDPVPLIRQAFAAWSQVANITFAQTTDGGGNIGVGTSADIRFVMATIDGAGSVVGKAYFPPSGGSGFFNGSEGDIVLDSGEQGYWTQSSFYLVTLHEIGHALGLSHEASVTAIMNPTINTALYNTGPLGTSLQQDDINGIVALYGAQDTVIETWQLAEGQANVTFLDTGQLRILGNGLANAITGAQGAETIVGGGGNDTIAGGAGNDVLFGDAEAAAAATSGIQLGSGVYVVPANLANSSVASAVNVSSLFSLASDPNIVAATTVPHVSITRRSGPPAQTDHFLVSIANAGSRLTIDIDQTNGFDSFVRVLNASGAVLANGDDSSTSDGAGGSSSGMDSFLVFTAPSAGNYVIQVGRYASSTPIAVLAGSDSYVLHVSVEGELDIGGNDRLLGEGGNDMLRGGAGLDTLLGGVGADTLLGDAGNDQLFGDQDNDFLYGWLGRDVLWGGSGFDTLFGEQDDDTLLGEAGEDVLWGGDGNDLLYGWEWNDTLFGEAGNDTLFGEQDNDVLYGWLGADLLWGGAGNDALWGEQDNDTLLGEAGNDVLLGIEGNDVMYGWTGNDSLYGWFGDDVLWGEAGNDLMLGEDGADVFIGGLGRDTMTGGQGADRFFNANFEMAAGEVDLITDYDAADRYLFQTGAQIQYFNFNAPGVGQSAGIHVQVAGGVFILDVFGATAAQLQAQTQFF